ncbi:MAG: peptidylprolyl isomerase [Clostridia bacterium]|nr:peptidylprolyl isomerase [Clostridia bacterium]
MSIKRVFTAIMAVALIISAFSGCGSNSGEVAETSAVDGSTVVATVGDREITMDEYRYFVFQAATLEMYSRNSEFTGDFSGVNWDETNENGVSLKDVVRDRALNEALQYALLAEDGEEKGVKLETEDTASIDTMLEQFAEQNGEEELLKNLKAMGVTSVDGYKKLSSLMNMYYKVEEDFGVNRDKYIEDEEKLKEYADSDKVSAQHILIMNDSEKHDNPEAAINAILERAKAGEDFEALMAENGEDPGQAAAGYSFGRGVMVPEFEAAAFALDYGEISDVVRSDYGSHIIKRVVGICEYTNYLKDNMTVDIDEKLINEISAAEIVTDIYGAITELQAQSGGAANE